MLCCVCDRDMPDNLIIFGKNICVECENELINARVDEPSYDEWIAKIEESVYEYDKTK